MMKGSRMVQMGARSMGSTKCGMNRILKKKLPVVQFIQKGVEAGTYRSNEEIWTTIQLLQDIERGKYDSKLADEISIETDARKVVTRFRENFIRGTSVQDYPEEYHILALNPPIPNPPNVPVKQWKRMKRDEQKFNNIHGRSSPSSLQQHLIQQYLHRNKQQQQQQQQQYEEIWNDENRKETQEEHKANKDDPSFSYKQEKDEEYYRRLFGIPESSGSDASSMMFTKSSILKQAYAYAIEQYKIMRRTGSSSSDKKTEEEIVQEVDELLFEQSKQEANTSRTLRKAIQSWRNTTSTTTTSTMEQQQQQQAQVLLNQPKAKATTAAKQEGEEENEDSTTTTTTTTSSSMIPSILHSKPRVVEGMMQWSAKLQAVPYHEWTVGASTALDHWIAKNVLEFSEQTWDSLLEGASYNHHNNYTQFLVSQGRDLIAVRQALFPETIPRQNIDQHDDHDDHDEMEMHIDDHLHADTDKHKSSSSIDDLLASLRGDNDNAKKHSSDQWDQEDHHEDDHDTDDNHYQAKMDQLTDQVQEWRKHHQQIPYEDWSPQEQTKFMNWLEHDYIATILQMETSTSSSLSDTNHNNQAMAIPMENKDDIDLDQTRKALLSIPPAPSRQTSNQLWQKIQDETEAQVFLQQLHQDYTNNNNNNNNNNKQQQQQQQQQQHQFLQSIVLQEAFFSLPYQKQLEQLIHLGSIRPILDEYTTEAKRHQFFVKYGDMLLDNIVMEHLLPDPNGPITYQQLGPYAHQFISQQQQQQQHKTKQQQQQQQQPPPPQHQRYRLQMLPYGTSGLGNISASQRSRMLFYCWNQQKANRARYEETMFRMGKLGFRYGEEPDDDNKDE